MRESDNQLINSIIANVNVENEEENKKRYRTFYIKLDSKRLLKVYGRIIKKIVTQGGFGKEFKEDSEENYRILLTEVNRREVDIPVELINEHNQVIDITIDCP